MRQQAGLLEHGACRFRQVGQGGAMAEAGQLVARGAVAQLRLVAEREQRLLAARRLSGPRDRQHLVEREIGALARRGGCANVQ